MRVSIPAAITRTEHRRKPLDVSISSFLTRRADISPDREAYVDFRQGDILLYRHDTWHRGTPLKPGTRRLAQNMTFRVADAEWVSTLHPGWSWSAYRPSQFLEKWIATCSVLQRTVMGFPAPGNAYWTEATLAAVAARYGPLGFDPTPYRL